MFNKNQNDNISYIIASTKFINVSIKKEVKQLCYFTYLVHIGLKIVYKILLFLK